MSFALEAPSIEDCEALFEECERLLRGEAEAAGERVCGERVCGERVCASHLPGVAEADVAEADVAEPDAANAVVDTGVATEVGVATGVGVGCVGEGVSNRFSGGRHVRVISSSPPEEVSTRSLINDVHERVLAKQREFLLELKYVYRISFLLITSKDGTTRTGLNIGSVPLMGFKLTPTQCARLNQNALGVQGRTLAIPSYRCIDLETAVLLHSKSDTTLGAVGMICDVLVQAGKLLQHPQYVTSRLRQRHGAFFVISGSDSATFQTTKPLLLPADRKSFTQQGSAYDSLYKISIQLCQVKFNELYQQTYRPPFPDLYLHIANLVNSV